MSFAQSRLWFLSQLPGPKPNYTEFLEMRFTSGFDHDAIVQALADVVARHESLRTIFPAQRGVPHQVVLPESVPVPLTAVAVTPQTLRSEVARARLEAFDLARDIPFRPFLFVTGETCVLLIVLHHIAVDWWSLQRVLLRDLWHAYESRRRGVPPAFRALPAQYADFTLWQATALGRPDDPQSLHAQQMEFWRRTLAGVPVETALPLDRARPTVPSFKGGVRAAFVDRRTHAALLALARGERASLFMVISACVATLLTRSGAGTDVPMGTPMSGRPVAALNDVVGFFANTVVLRADTSGNPTCRELVQRLRRTVLEASRHDAVPFEHIVETLNPARTLARNPLFQVMLGFRTFLRARARAAPMKLSEVPRPGPRQVRFDLTFDVTERRGTGATARGLHLQVQYSADLFDEATAERLAHGLRLVIGAFAATPDRRIAEIDVVGAAQRAQVLDVGRGAEFEPDATIVEQFELQVRRTPARRAVACGGTRITYGELNAAANRVARELIARGLGAEQVIAVAVPRSIELVTFVLAVWKAGASCLLLDLEQPTAYLEHVVRTIAPQCILTVSPYALAFGDVPVFVQDPLRDEGHAAAHGDPGVRVSPHASAYVAFTAGRTGPARPVTVSHAGLTRAAHLWRIETGCVGSEACFSATPVGADVAFVDLIGPLTCGAEVVLASDEEILYPELCGAGERPRVVQGTPARIRRWLPHLAGSNQRYLIGRDVDLPVDLAQSIAAAGGEIHHLYGTTETCVWSTAHRLRERPDAPVAAGAPLPGASVYVLDERLQAVPVGVSGDIYIGGLIARGYHRQPGATAAAFVADPFGAPGSRMVRTGDRGRWTTEHLLHLLPPADCRPPSAGLMTSTVRRLPGVSDAEAVLQTGEDGRVTRALFVTVDRGQPGPDEIHRCLERTLPADALPDVVMVLDRLPLTPNGTLDCRALPRARRDESRDRAATEIDTRLCALVAEVLRRPLVTPGDNFFDLGGHSLAVMQLLNRIRSSLGVELDVRAVFDAQTISGLSRRIEAAIASPSIPSQTA